LFGLLPDFFFQAPHSAMAAGGGFLSVADMTASHPGSFAGISRRGGSRFTLGAPLLRIFRASGERPRVYASIPCALRSEGCQEMLAALGAQGMLTFFVADFK
jgi:hypothetical protein